MNVSSCGLCGWGRLYMEVGIAIKSIKTQNELLARANLREN